MAETAMIGASQIQEPETPFESPTWGGSGPSTQIISYLLLTLARSWARNGELKIWSSTPIWDASINITVKCTFYVKGWHRSLFSRRVCLRDLLTFESKFKDETEWIKGASVKVISSAVKSRWKHDCQWT